MGNWHNHRHRDQRNGIETLEINPHIYGHMIFDWDARLFNKKRILFSINGVGKTEYLYTKRETDPLQ